MMAAVIAFMEIGIGQNSLTGNIVKRDVLSGEFRRRSNNERVGNAFRQRNRPLQCLHAAQTSADNGRPFLNAEIIGKHGLGLHPVFDGYHRKIRAIFVAGFRIFGQRAGTAVAAAQVVQTDNEKSVRYRWVCRGRPYCPTSRRIYPPHCACRQRDDCLTGRGR